MIGFLPWFAACRSWGACAFTCASHPLQHLTLTRPGLPGCQRPVRRFHRRHHHRRCCHCCLWRRGARRLPLQPPPEDSEAYAKGGGVEEWLVCVAHSAGVPKRSAYQSGGVKPQLGATWIPPKRPQDTISIIYYYYIYIYIDISSCSTNRRRSVQECQYSLPVLFNWSFS